VLQVLRRHPVFSGLAEALQEGHGVHVEGLWGSSAACCTAALADEVDGPWLAVLPTVEEAEMFAEDLDFFAPGKALYFPPWETLEEDELPDAEILSQRFRVLRWLEGTGRGSSAREHRVIVAPVQAVLQPLPSREALDASRLVLKRGDERSPESIAAWLSERDFRPAMRVEAPGEFCRRGGILDVFPVAAEEPVRIEFFGDVIESIRTFAPDTQASSMEVTEATLTALPRLEIGGAGRAPGRGTGAVSICDYLPDNARLMLKEPAEVLARAPLPESLTDRRSAEACHEALRLAPQRFSTLYVAALPGTFGAGCLTFHVHSVERFGRDIAGIVREIELMVASRDRTIVVCANSGERERLEEILAGSPVLEDERFEIRLGRMNRSFDWADLSLALIAHNEIFNRYRQRRVPARYRQVRPLEGFYELAPDDLVVHAAHGVGIFRGMETIEKGDGREECLRIEYADGAILYVPASQIDLVQKYIGPSERRPPLSRLGSQAWSKRKEQAAEAVRDLAAELLRLQAVRRARPGIAHPPDSDWQYEFEAAFPYEETEDQLRVSAEVKADLENPRPMDRLVCGDVGYGKTEIAMRAAFKVVMGGRQVAVLVPTTVLAAQHFQTFRERMADYPVVIGMLSRFLTRAQQREVIEQLASGRMDVVIGTHRLIQPDVHFRDLGLVIIDEEQRFGVEHKERLKRLKETVDVLTLTATPIPRTLHMSLIGLRDIATLETPPRDRLAIQTRLMRFDASRIRQAILHEMSRGGQVFFVHNRVETIQAMAKRLREIVPEARILVGHGQMPERELAAVMRDFVEHRADVLLCTTIIESGLDIPNANTIIINNADMFGLADLHQLRGRVGRYKHRAYAYMVVSPERPVNPAAEKRLKAIEEFCELGAGFRIATRDLEIRGAGNILGPEQSGHIAAVGYDMYCRLLEQAVRALKNEPMEERPEVALALGVDAYLPDDYVPHVTERIDLYRRLNRACDEEAIEAVRGEMCDRFGTPPPPAENLLAQARLRLRAWRAAIRSIVRHDSVVIARAEDPDRAALALRKTGWVVRQVDDRTLYVRPDDSRISGDLLLSCLLDALA